MIFQLGANQRRYRIKILSAGCVSLTYKISFKLISYKQAARDVGLDSRAAASTAKQPAYTYNVAN